jgi:hypothetical protein
MKQPDERPQPCLILTATVQVNENLCLTVRRDWRTRLADYRSAFHKWIKDPHVASMVFVENSGFDLSEFAEIAKSATNKRVEFLSFKCPPFDGSLGKGYGEMLCLEYCLQHSKLINSTTRFLKVSGRYYLLKADVLLRFISEQSRSDVICNFKDHLTWADSRAFGGSVQFLKEYLCPMKDQVNETGQSEFEHVLARAVHNLMANSGGWSMTPHALQIDGTSASHGRRLKQKLKHSLISKGISL